MNAFYDFSKSPHSYDFAQFHPQAIGAGCDHFVFVPGERGIQKCTPEEQKNRLEKIMLPLCKSFTVCKTREEAKKYVTDDCFPPGYTVEKPKAYHLLGDAMRTDRLGKFKASPECLSKISFENYITITIRDSRISPKRNSNIPEWMKAAEWFKEQGYTVVFVPDVESENQAFGAFDVCQCDDIQLRLALYEKAVVNLFVNNGPFSLCLFSDNPYILFKPVTMGHKETSPSTWEMNGVPVGSQFPNASNKQVLRWTDDTFEDIKNGFEVWMDGKKLPVIKGVMSAKDRHAQMRNCLTQGFKPFKQQPNRNDVLTIACYGPSLKYTWTQIKHPLMTVSGAHHFLLEGGVVPEWHMDIDPRPHKAVFTKNPHKDVHYLMASVCHEDVWKNLNGMNVSYWHLIDGPHTNRWCEENDPKTFREGGGTTAGLRALVIGIALGFKKFELHGFDSSFSNSGKHAGEHPSEDKESMLVKVGGDTFYTSFQLFQQARELVQFISTVPVSLKVHGYGLAQAMLKEAQQIVNERKAA